MTQRDAASLQMELGGTCSTRQCSGQDGFSPFIFLQVPMYYFYTVYNQFKKKQNRKLYYYRVDTARNLHVCSSVAPRKGVAISTHLRIHPLLGQALHP